MWFHQTDFRWEPLINVLAFNKQGSNNDLREKQVLLGGTELTQWVKHFILTQFSAACIANG